ncbi:hypothetical protein ACQI4L_26210 [Mycolicibacterium litorale]|uniref:hypothetical protein n=1 Tax=Mycolicibacterium litorale TaxID=758802 RepID=UPI003CF39C53
MSDDNGVARVARAFAGAVGLVLHRFVRPGTERRIEDETNRDLIEHALSIKPSSYQEFRKLGVDEIHADLPGPPRLDPALGKCRVFIPGICDAHRPEDLAEFIEQYV